MTEDRGPETGFLSVFRLPSPVFPVYFPWRRLRVLVVKVFPRPPGLRPVDQEPFAGNAQDSRAPFQVRLRWDRVIDEQKDPVRAVPQLI